VSKLHKSSQYNERNEHKVWIPKLEWKRSPGSPDAGIILKMALKNYVERTWTGFN
jgi:hypothetical protein